MHLTNIHRAALPAAAALLVCSIALAQSASAPQTAGAGGQTPASLDGKWLTKLTCPAKGNTEGYTWEFASVIQNSNFAESTAQRGNPATC